VAKKLNRGARGRVDYQCKKEAREQEQAWQTQCCQMIKRRKQWPNMRRKKESMRVQQRSQTAACVEVSTHQCKKQAREQERAQQT